MRFIYGLIFGVLASVIAAILYLAFAGGEHLLVLSPRYHEMRSRLGELEKAEQQRAELAQRLEALEGRFRELGTRFESLRSAASGETAQDAPAPETAPPTVSPGSESPATPETDAAD